MQDLISRAAVIDAIQQHREGVLGGYEYDEGVAFVYAAAHNHITEVIKRLPSVELVRCLECKYCRKVDESEYWCYGFCSPARLVRKDDFCSHGCKYE